MFKALLNDLEKSPRWLLWALAIFSTGLLGWLDYITGFEASFSFFYLLPIALTAWGLGQNASMLLSLISALIWGLANKLAGESHSSILVFFWNMFIRIGFFAIVSILLSKLHRQIQHDRDLARIDFLTGAFNRRAFYDTILAETKRISRYQHPFTLVYLDADNFKWINDHLGHQVGDQVLQAITYTLTNNLRELDCVARLGGDEFAILFPETDQAAATIALPRLQQALLQEMTLHEWPVTFSMGAIIFHQSPPGDVDKMINLADQVMYQVKQSNKNAISYAVYQGENFIEHLS